MYSYAAQTGDCVIGKPLEVFFKTRIANFVYAVVLVASFTVSASDAQDISQQANISVLRDPQICSSFEPIQQINSFGCEVKPYGRDNNGDERKIVRINLTAQTKKIIIGGELVETENYGTYLPPVIEARAGDTVAITLTNSLSLVESGHSHRCEPDENRPTPPLNSIPTNLHYFHGGIVSPKNGNSPGSARWGIGDNIYSCLERGQEHTFVVDIPGYKELNAAVLEGEKGERIAHPPGLNWYHSHLHGISSNQVMGGMAGLLSVGRRDENIRAMCDDPGSDECEEKTAEVRSNTLVKYALLRDISLKKENGNWVPDPEGQNFRSHRVCGVLREDGVTFDVGNTGLRMGFCRPNQENDESTDVDESKLVDADKLWLFTINGQKFPTIIVDETKTGVLLRLGNLSPNFAYWLELYDEEASDPTNEIFVHKNMTIVSVDGVVPAKPQSAADDAEQISVASYRIPDLLLMPASRVEIYIDRGEIDNPKEDKTYVLRTKKLDAGGDVWPEIQLARITFKASEKKPVLLALNAVIAETVAVPEFAVLAAGSPAGVERPRPDGCMRDLRDGEYRRVRFAADIFNPGKWKIYSALMKNEDVQTDHDGTLAEIDKNFEEYVNSDHSINWEKKHTCIELKDESEQKPQLWELHNETGDLHNFHIHQMKFRLATLEELREYGIVKESGPVPPSSTCDGVADCDQPDYKFYELDDPETKSVSNLGRAEVNDTGTITSIIEWHDTIPMPPEHKVYVMMSFADKVQVGRFVYHCHILKHEDNGLMAPIEMWDPSAPAE